MMSSFEDQEENPAEPVPDVATTAEPPQPPEPSFEDERLAGEEEPQINASVPSDNQRNTTEASSTSSGSRTKRTDRFSQTFIKFAKNLTNRRLVDIINAKVDHGQNSMVFYRTSEELLRSFEDGMNQ